MKILDTEVTVTRDMLQKQDIRGPAEAWEAKRLKISRTLGLSLTDLVTTAVNINYPEHDKPYRLKRRHQIMRAYANKLKYNDPEILGPVRRLIAVLEAILPRLTLAERFSSR